MIESYEKSKCVFSLIRKPSANFVSCKLKFSRNIESAKDGYSFPKFQMCGNEICHFFTILTRFIFISQKISVTKVTRIKLLKKNCSSNLPLKMIFNLSTD